MSRERTPIISRKGIRISEETRRAYEARDTSRDIDPHFVRPTPDQLANAMRRDKWFRPIKKPITMRIDADVFAWLQASGEGYQTRLNQTLRERMEAEQKQANVRT